MRRPCVLKTSSWSNKRLLRNDDSLETFSWPHDTGALIDDMKHLSEIADLHEQIQEPAELAGYFAVPMHFQDAFVDSHDFMIDLLDRVSMAWNNSAQEQIIILHQGKNTENEVVSYKSANIMFKKTRERVLHMRWLYEQLTPETQDLVHRCSSFLQIENSMLAQKQAPLQDSVVSMQFQPACGFKLQRPLLTKATMHERINDVEKQLADMQMEKDLLLQKLHDDEMLEDAMQTSDSLRIVLCNGKGIVDPLEAVKYAHEVLVPYKNILERHSTMFEHTLYMIPEPFPEFFPITCTADDVIAFYNDTLHALDKDNQHIKMIRSKIRQQ
jgi:hypothetical protein